MALATFLQLLRPHSLEEQRAQRVYLADTEKMAQRLREIFDEWLALFTEDADYVVYTGTHYRGRRKIADAHDALWARFLKGSRLRGVIDDIRFPGPDVAILLARGAG